MSESSTQPDWQTLRNLSASESSFDIPYYPYNSPAKCIGDKPIIGDGWQQQFVSGSGSIITIDSLFLDPLEYTNSIVPIEVCSFSHPNFYTIKQRVLRKQQQYYDSKNSNRNAIHHQGTSHRRYEMPSPDTVKLHHMIKIIRRSEAFRYFARPLHCLLTRQFS
jgi:ribosomal protein L31